MKRKTYIFALIALPFMVLGFARTGDLSYAPVDEDAVAAIWKTECSSCHGNDGKGETRAGRRAGVKDFTDLAYQKSWTDDEAVLVIKTAKKDGKELRNKNPFADELSEAQIRQLVAFVRQFAPKG